MDFFFGESQNIVVAFVSFIFDRVFEISEWILAFFFETLFLRKVQTEEEAKTNKFFG